MQAKRAHEARLSYSEPVDSLFASGPNGTDVKRLAASFLEGNTVRSLFAIY